MIPDRPTKGTRDASFVVKHRGGPTKAGPPQDDQRTADISDQRAGYSTKAPVDPAAIQKAQTAQTAPTGEREPPHTPDQLPGRHRPEPGGEQYLRLTIRVDDGALSIVDSHLVAGPLAQTETLQGGHAYEVTANGRVLHVGSIPDLGTFRSFAHPNGTLEQRRHHSYQLSTYEFEARVALSDLRGIDPAGLVIALYRVKQPDGAGAPTFALDLQSFSRKREQQLREIGRVIGIPRSALPDGFATDAPSDTLRRPNIRKIRGTNERSDDDAAD